MGITIANCIPKCGCVLFRNSPKQNTQNIYVHHYFTTIGLDLTLQHPKFWKTHDFWTAPRPPLGHRETPRPAAHRRWGTWVRCVNEERRNSPVAMFFSLHQYCPIDFIAYHEISWNIMKNIIKYQQTSDINKSCQLLAWIWPGNRRVFLPFLGAYCGVLRSPCWLVWR